MRPSSVTNVFNPAGSSRLRLSSLDGRTHSRSWDWSTGLQLMVVLIWDESADHFLHESIDYWGLFLFPPQASSLWSQSPGTLAESFTNSTTRCMEESGPSCTHLLHSVCVWLPAANAVCTAAGMSWALVCIWAGQRPVWPYWEDLCSAAPAGSLPPLHGKPTAPHKEATCSTGFCPQGELWATLILWTTAKENTGLLKKILVTHFEFLILFFFTWKQFNKKFLFL